jgi:hypothetical protein
MVQADERDTRELVKLLADRNVDTVVLNAC